MTGGKFAPLTIMNNENIDMDSVITYFSTAVTETASDIPGKHHQKKKPCVTTEIFDMCDKRRELRKKRFVPEGSEKFKEVDNSIKRCMKKAKENWIGERCSEMEENLRKNNNKRTQQLLKDLTTVKQGTAVQGDLLRNLYSYFHGTRMDLWIVLRISSKRDLTLCVITNCRTRHLELL